MSKRTYSGRTVACPRCGTRVSLPWFWILGIEGIFRCPTCRWTFKTGYKMGAIFSALALSLSTVVLQLLVYVLSVNALPVVILVWIPLWVFLSFRLRRWWMMRKAARRFARLAPSEPLSEATEATETPDAE